MFNLATFGLIGSTTGLAGWNVIAQVDPSIIEQGGSLAKLGVPGILGAVAIASIIGLVKVFQIYKTSNDMNNQKLQELISKGIESSVEAKDVMTEVVEVIRGCKKHD